MDTSETIGDQDPDTIESTDPTDTLGAQNTTDAPDLDVDPEQRLVDGLDSIRSAAIALKACEDVLFHYHAEQAVTTILVDTGEDEYLVAQPKGRNDE